VIDDTGDGYGYDDADLDTAGFIVSGKWLLITLSISTSSNVECRDVTLITLGFPRCHTIISAAIHFGDQFFGQPC